MDGKVEPGGAGKGKGGARGWWREVLAGLFLLLVAIIFFWRVTLGGKVLLPFDTLFYHQPWRQFAAQEGVGIPHNALLGDLVLENYAWKRFLVECLRNRQLPLWNPYLFAGAPFLAAGQHSALYPSSILFYLLPISRAYGYFTVLQLALAGVFMYLYLRVLGARRWGALLAGLLYGFSAFMMVRVVFPMALSVCAWLPLVITAVELAVRRMEEAKEGSTGLTPALPYLVLGTAALGIQFLAGHIEFSYYVLMVAAFYSLARLAVLWRKVRSPGRALSLALGLFGMVLLGVGIGAIQLIPLAELVRLNFRQDSASFQQILGWAYPLRQFITFLIPDFFGNPSHHSYFDLFLWKTLPVVKDFNGKPIESIFWGIKNYVEAGTYLGVLPLVLALLALRRRSRYVFIFAALAAISLLFAFGTPLYALLYYLIPGYKQLHTPFRWVFPYAFSVAVLAGLGAEELASKAQSLRQRGNAFWLEWIVLGVGGAMALGLAITRLWPGPFLRLIDQYLAATPLAQRAFANARVFYSYQFRNFLFFAVTLLGAGLVLGLARRQIRVRVRWGDFRLWQPLAVGLVMLDLGFLLADFNPACEAGLERFTPPVVEFLREDKGFYRIGTLDRTDINEKLFNPNVGMYYGLSDIRGYDSIIPKQYTEFMNLIEPQDQLIYNRIAPLYDPASLDSPLLDLLNVKYILTTRQVDSPNYTLVYDGEVRVYRNDDFLPRAFLVPKARILGDREEMLAKLKGFDPRGEVLLEEEPEGVNVQAREPPPTREEVSIVDYSYNQVLIAVAAPKRSFLVLSDSHFPGWRAYLSAEGMAEREVKLYRANYNFRAVEVPPGRWTLRFKYSPLSFKVGLFASFISTVVMALALATWAWGRYYRDEGGAAQRVAKNSLTLIALSLLNKGIDMAFAMLMLRVLKPEGAGKYGFAIVFIGYFEILSRFGLGTLLTREVAKDKREVGRYLGNTIALRLVLWLASLPLMGLVLALYWRMAGLGTDTAAAIGLFALAVVPSVLADAVSAVFNAHEKMEYPAFVSTFTTLVKVSLGIVVLLQGWGFVGLAGVSIVSNFFTLALLVYLVLKVIGKLRLAYERPFAREMMATSYPLMLNHLLATIFFRADVMLLKPLAGDAQVGWYTAAYRFIDGLNVVPAYFTMAIFPIISRYAATAKESLRRAYMISLRLLFMLSFPTAVGTTLVSPQLIAILGGAEYVADSTLALRLLIWSVPFGFINSVTQYVLIALDEQRYITKSFIMAVGFNIVANLILIPRFGYRACAILTIVSEIVLLVPFYLRVRAHIGDIPLLSLGWRPALAALAMGAVVWPVRGENILLLLPLAICVYIPVLLLLGGLSEEERTLLAGALPGRWRRLIWRGRAS